MKNIFLVINLTNFFLIIGKQTSTPQEGKWRMNRHKFIDCKPLKDFLLLDIAKCGERDYNDFMKVNVLSTDLGSLIGNT